MRNLILWAIPLAGLLVLSQCQYDWRKAQKAAEQFASQVPGATGKASCTHTDSDGDGYCACTVFRKDGSVLRVDCGCEKYCLICTEGCKVVEGVKVQGGRKITNIKLR